MKKNIVICIGFLLVFTCLFSGYKLYTQEAELKKEKYRNEVFKDKILSQYDFAGSLSLPSSSQVINKNGQNVRILDVTGNTSKLIFRFSVLDSKICRKTILPFLKNISKQIGEKNILLLSSKNQLKNNLHFYQKNNLTSPIFGIEDGLLKNNIETTRRPYLFILTPDLKGHSAYLPEIDMEDVTQLYFSRVPDYFRRIDLTEEGIHFDKMDINLGEIKVGRKYSVDFDFTNTMHCPLIINDVKTSCGCTVANWSKKPIKPREKSKMEVIYEATHKGFFFKSIRVSSNAENNLVELRIKGTVV